MVVLWWVIFFVHLQSYVGGGDGVDRVVGGFRLMIDRDEVRLD